MGQTNGRRAGCRVFTTAIAAVWPQLGYLYFLSMAALAFIPITMVIAVFRYDLFDIDRILSATATYNLLAVILLNFIVDLAYSWLDPRIRRAGGGRS